MPPAAGGFAPRPPKQPPHCEFLATRLDRPTSFIGDQCDKLIQLTALFESIKHVEQKISNLKRDLKYVEIKLDDLEQYGRSNCNILHESGIEQNGNYGAFCEKVTEKLNNSLKLTKKVTIKDIDTAHNLSKAGNKRNSIAEITQGKSKPPIIIKFVRRSVRNDVFFSKKSLSGSGTFISESLTNRRLSLQKESQKNFGERNTWSMKSDIYVSIDGN